MDPSHIYFMESDSEYDRLNLKTDRQETLSQLLAVGFNNLPRSPHIVDAGCGGGFVSAIMLKYLNKKQSSPYLTLLDMSEQRIRAAEKLLLSQKSNSRLKFIPCFLEKIPLPSNSQDFVFSRFVFEYLKRPEMAFSELVRITKRGGKLVIADLDNNCLLHYGLNADIANQINEIGCQLYRKGFLDPWIGRKLYSYFYDKKMKEIKVHVKAHHLFYGKISRGHFKNWIAKLDQLVKFQSKKKIILSFSALKFKRRFLKFFSLSRRFSYTPLITVEGVKK